MIFEAIDFALVVGYGFWIVNSLHFFVWFLGFYITWFQLLRCAQCVLHVGSSYEFYIGHLVFGFCVLCTLGYGFWIPGCLSYNYYNSNVCWIIDNKFLQLDPKGVQRNVGVGLRTYKQQTSS